MSLARGIRVGLAVACVLFISAASGSSQTVFRVVVHASEHVDATLLARGLAEAARIYERGGIMLTWALPSNTHEHGSMYLIVHPRDANAAPGRAVLLGSAPRAAHGTGRIAYAFIEPLEDFAVKYGVAEGLLLGAVIAHELAHVLAPDLGHSEGSLMRAEWGAAEAWAVNHGSRFTPLQYQALRARLGTWRTRPPQNARR